MTRPPRYVARRARQTLGFANGPRVLVDLAAARTPWRRPELLFRTRSGIEVACPNLAGARLAVYEHLIEDAYEVGELTDGLRDDFVVVDVGAQVGAFSLAVAEHSPRCTVHAFEASPGTAGWLRRNVDSNALGSRVLAHAVAIADHEGTLEFAETAEGSVHNGLTAPEGAHLVTVPCTTLAAAFALAGGRVDVVKMDAEGAEYDSILSSPPEIWQRVQRVVIEHHPVPGYSWSELEAFLADVGLEVSKHEPAGRPGLGLAWLRRRG